MFKCALLMSGLLCASSALGGGEHADPSGKTMLPADHSFWSQQELLGRWGDVRTALDDAGLHFSGIYKGDNLGNLSGGSQRRFVYIHNLDLNLTVDGEKALGLSGAALFAQVFHNNGASFSAYVGDAQVASNIEAGDFTKLYQFWIQQEFLDGRFSFLVGLYDASSDFYVTRSTGAFLNSTFGTGKELAQTGSNGPSIFPNTALAIRMRAAIAGPIVAQVAVIDATPGSEDDPYAASFVINSRDGALVTAEVAWVDGWTSGEEQRYSKLAAGAWTYTRYVPAIFAAGYSNDGGILRANSGLYVVAEGQVSQSLSFFFRGGMARQEMNQFTRNFAAGFSATGIIPDRDDDQFGVGVAYAENGSAYRDAMANAGMATEAAEVSVESTYRATIAPWLILQPDVQYIINPGTDPGLENAFVAGVRVEIHL